MLVISQWKYDLIGKFTIVDVCLIELAVLGVGGSFLLTCFWSDARKKHHPKARVGSIKSEPTSNLNLTNCTICHHECTNVLFYCSSSMFAISSSGVFRHIKNGGAFQQHENDGRYTPFIVPFYTPPFIIPFETFLNHILSHLSSHHEQMPNPNHGKVPKSSR